MEVGSGYMIRCGEGLIKKRGEATGNRKNVHGHITGGGSGTDNF